MAEEIKDGTGTGNMAEVDARGHLHTFGVTRTEKNESAFDGDDYNLNTGKIALTGTAVNSLMYFKNDELEDFVVTALAVGMGTRSATVTDLAEIKVIRNPTGGDIISDATAVSINSNNNFGSSKTLKSTTLVYAGKTAGTISGGDDHLLLFMGDGRLFAGLDMVVPKGSSLGVTIDLNTSGGANVYCALIGYFRTPDWDK